MKGYKLPKNGYFEKKCKIIKYDTFFLKINCWCLNKKQYFCTRFLKLKYYELFFF